IPPTLDPVDVVQGIIAAMMHAASDIDQPFGSLDECRQHVWCERVYREDLRVSLWRRAAVGLAKDAGVVDDRVHAPDLVDLIRERPSLRRVREISDHDAGCTRREIRERLRSAFFGAR